MQKRNQESRNSLENKIVKITSHLFVLSWPLPVEGSSIHKCLCLLILHVLWRIVLNKLFCGYAPINRPELERVLSLLYRDERGKESGL